MQSEKQELLKETNVKVVNCIMDVTCNILYCYMIYNNKLPVVINYMLLSLPGIKEQFVLNQ